MCPPSHIYTIVSLPALLSPFLSLLRQFRCRESPISNFPTSYPSLLPALMHCSMEQLVVFACVRGVYFSSPPPPPFRSIARVLLFRELLPRPHF